MTDTIIYASLFGLIGGSVRVIIGVLKALALNRKVLWGYWIIAIILGGLVGLVTGSIFSFDYRLSVLSGYAGTDILEAVYKSFKVDKFIVRK